MSKIEEFARTKGYKYLLLYADQITVEKKYTLFRSRISWRLTKTLLRSNENLKKYPSTKGTRVSK